MKIKLTLNLSKLTGCWTRASIDSTSKVSLGLRLETGVWLSPPVKYIMIDWHPLVFISKQNDRVEMLLFFPKRQGQAKKCRPQSNVNPQRTWLARTIFCVNIWRQCLTFCTTMGQRPGLSVDSVRDLPLSLPGTNPMNLPRVKYLSSSWDRKAVSPRSGFSAISCVTLNCAQEQYSRVTRLSVSTLSSDKFLSPSLVTRLLSESGNYHLRISDLSRIPSWC